MLAMWKKILATGLVTEELGDSVVPEAYRGAVELDKSFCSCCASCVRACPTAAISLSGNYPEVDGQACIYCGQCVDSCPGHALRHTDNYRLARIVSERLGTVIGKVIRQKLGRSLAIRHVDVGSCNACDWEMTALTNPVYDIQQYGIDFVASPRHADMLMITGVVTRNLLQSLMLTYEAAPAPKLVMAVGSCACSGSTYGKSYALCGAVDQVVPVDIFVPGCPPRPQAILYGLLLSMGRL